VACTQPVIRSDWVREGTHITVICADAAGEQELNAELVARAECLVVDLVSQCVDHAEVSHAVRLQRIDQSRLDETGQALESPHTSLRCVCTEPLRGHYHPEAHRYPGIVR